MEKDDLIIGRKCVHNKSGKFYKILGIGKHSESLEEFVIYQALYLNPQKGDYQIWIRPLEMFVGQVEIEGKKLDRFSFIKHGV